MDIDRNNIIENLKKQVPFFILNEDDIDSGLHIVFQEFVDDMCLNLVDESKLCKYVTFINFMGLSKDSLVLDVLSSTVLTDLYIELSEEDFNSIKLKLNRTTVLLLEEAILYYLKGHARKSSTGQNLFKSFKKS